MKILVATKHLKSYAGSELFTRDLVFALRNCGHEVFVFTKELGLVSEQIFLAGIPITNDLSDFEKEKFDIIHAQHSITTVLARAFFPKVPMVYLAHGTMSEFEKLPKLDFGIDYFLGVSDEIRSNFIEKKLIKSEKTGVVRNFIDTEKFFCMKPLNEKPKKLLVLSNHYVNSVKKTIEGACKELDIKVFHVGKPENPQKEVIKFINEADIVVTLGRGVLEAMACERNVIIYDWNEGDGFVNEKSFYEARTKGLSGRLLRKKYTVKEFKEEIFKYDPKLGKTLREIIIKEHSPQATVSLLEETYKKAIAEFPGTYKKNLITQILLNKKIAPFYVLFIILLNKFLKLLRIVGLKKV